MNVKDYKKFKPKKKVIYWITVNGRSAKNAIAKEFDKTKNIRANGGLVVFINENAYENDDVKVEVRPLRQVLAESIQASTNRKNLQAV